MIIDTNAIAEGRSGYRRARFSSDRTHRYTLEELLCDVSGGLSRGRACFLMCNPSTADALVLDPTVSRCRSWARRWSYESYEVVNLFSFRTTYPSVLKEVGEKAGREFREPRDMELPSDWREAREQAIRFAMGSDPINDAEILAACMHASEPDRLRVGSDRGCPYARRSNAREALEAVQAPSHGSDKTRLPKASRSARPRCNPHDARADRMVTAFSQQPCSRCGWKHALDDFKPRDKVRVLHHSVRERSGKPSRVGETAMVREWSQYGGPVYVRVQFDDGERENFDPCEIEHA